MAIVLEKINPPTLPDAPSMGYSQITVAQPGKIVFVAGQVAWTPDGAAVPSALEDQTRIATQNLVHALEAVGGTLANVGALRIYVVDLKPEHTAALLPVLKGFMGDVLPTITVVGVTGLAAAELKIEIEATAVL